MESCYRSSKLIFLLVFIHLASCGREQPTGRIQQAPTKQPPVTRTESAAVYSWEDAKTGPGYMPKVRSMMDWYATQADNIRQMDFIEGQPESNPSDDGPTPKPRGPYDVTFDIVNDYLTILRKSGYFSEHYLTTLKAQAQAKQLALQKNRTTERNMPHIKGLPLFAANYDDMISRTGSLHFSAEEAGKVIVLNDGYSLERFVFDSTGKIDAVR